MPTLAGFLLRPFYLIVPWAYVVLATLKNEFPSLNSPPWKCKQPSRNRDHPNKTLGSLTLIIRLLKQGLPRKWGSCQESYAGGRHQLQWEIVSHREISQSSTSLSDHLTGWDWRLDDDGSMMGETTPSPRLFWCAFLYPILKLYSDFRTPKWLQDPELEAFKLFFIPLPYVTTLNKFSSSPFLLLIQLF